MQCDFQCGYCGGWNSTDVDESAGLLQQCVEDCEVCCQPNLLSIRFDPRQEQFIISVERES